MSTVSSQSGKSYSFNTNPTGKEALVCLTEQIIEEFNKHAEEEKNRKDHCLKIIQKTALDYQKVIEAESHQKLTFLHEKMQDSLEAINTGLSDLQDDEEELQNFMHELQMLNKDFGLLGDHKEDKEETSKSGEDKMFSSTQKTQ